MPGFKAYSSGRSLQRYRAATDAQSLREGPREASCVHCVGAGQVPARTHTCGVPGEEQGKARSSASACAGRD